MTGNQFVHLTLAYAENILAPLMGLFLLLAVISIILSVAAAIVIESKN